jgi:hypothetical protein
MCFIRLEPSEAYNIVTHLKPYGLDKDKRSGAVRHLDGRQPESQRLFEDRMNNGSIAPC